MLASRRNFLIGSTAITALSVTGLPAIAETIQVNHYVEAIKAFDELIAMSPNYIENNNFYKVSDRMMKHMQLAIKTQYNSHFTRYHNRSYFETNFPNFYGMVNSTQELVTIKWEDVHFSDIRTEIVRYSKEQNSILFSILLLKTCLGVCRMPFYTYINLEFSNTTRMFKHFLS